MEMNDALDQSYVLNHIPYACEPVYETNKWTQLGTDILLKLSLLNQGEFMDCRNFISMILDASKAREKNPFLPSYYSV